MTTRDSSVNAIAELRTLRLARVRERVEAERKQKEEAARAEAQREAEAARLVEERAAEAAAQIDQFEQVERPSEPEARTSRTTLERIADMRHELRVLVRERAEARSAREARIEALMLCVAEPPTHWAPQVTTLLVAAGVFVGLVLQAPAPEAVSTAVPAPPPEMAETLADGPPVDDAVREASEVALLEEAEIPLIAEDTAEAAPDAAPEPALAPRKKPKRVPANTSSKASKSAPPLDALGNLADCGDDPICGLGL